MTLKKIILLFNKSYLAAVNNYTIFKLFFVFKKINKFGLVNRQKLYLFKN